MSAGAPDPDDATADDGEAGSGRLGRTIAIAAAGMVLPLVGLIMLARSCTRTAMGGEVSIAGDHGWHASLDHCRTGELDSFTGVSLGRDATPIVRAIDDPDRGPVVEVTPPAGGTRVTVDGRSCPGLRLDLRRVGADGDGAAIVDGSVTAHCALADGRTLDLRGWWHRCAAN